MFSDDLQSLVRSVEALLASLHSLTWPETAAEWALDAGLIGLVLWILAFGLIAVLRGGSRLVTSRNRHWHRLCERLISAHPSRAGMRQARRLVNHHFVRFASQWIIQFDMASPSQREELVRLALESGLLNKARTSLTVNEHQTVLTYALRVVARIRDQESLARVHQILISYNPNLAFEAARCLMQIDPEHSINEVLLRAVTHPGWNLMQIKLLLQGARPQAVSSGFWSCMDVIPDTEQYKLIPCLPFTDPSTATFPLTKFLPLLRREEWLAAGLELAAEPELLPVIRQLLDHPAESVRLSALKAIRKLGDMSDLPKLKACLADSSWGIRYWAAMPIVDWLGEDEAAIEGFMASLPDSHAQETLSTVIAERQI